MTDPSVLIATASLGTLGLTLSSAAALRAWHGWLDVRRAGIGSGRPVRASTATRVEIARLRERVRRLEAIASGSQP